MKKTDFYYDLPKSLIAFYPKKARTGSRLLCLERLAGGVTDRQFPEIEELLNPGDLLVFNDTKVIPARVYGQKSTGGKVEILVERIVGSQVMLAQVRASKPPKAGGRILLEGGVLLEVTGRENDLFALRVPGEDSVLDVLDRVGHVPLPPYIDRVDEPVDEDRYQTVFCKTPGAVAAPTAGLHFDQPMLGRLRKKGVRTAFVTLHVGAGTFQPVRVDDVRDHKMHSEWLSVASNVVEAVRQTKEAGGRVIAVGTTSVRSLETASRGGTLKAYSGETDIFIYPGYEFQTVDGLITNFHLPESTLVMLVAAFSGREAVLAAYQHAVEENYRFFSYGDAMFIV